MRTTLILLIGLLQVVKAEVPPVKLVARITYYHSNEPGYTYGRHIAACPKRLAKPNYTCAVDNQKIPYGTKLYIPALKGLMGDGTFIAEDTGGDVKKLKAIPKAKRKLITHVIDIYVDSAEQMRKMAKKNPMYLEVFLLTKDKNMLELVKN